MDVAHASLSSLIGMLPGSLDCSGVSLPLYMGRQGSLWVAGWLSASGVMFYPQHASELVDAVRALLQWCIKNNLVEIR